MQGRRRAELLSDPVAFRGYAVGMQDITDANLLDRWRTGDREAYAVLVARHVGLVQAACRRQAASGEEEDCAQAVFLVLARKPAGARRAPNLQAWLLRVAWYVCQRSRRAAQRRRQAEYDAAAVSRAQPTLAKPEALDHLDSCLLKLPARQRAAISLHYLAGKPAEEVADTLGVSRDNAYQLISRGLTALRALLAQRGVAVASAALASLLASEGEAALATSPTAALASLTATPSASVASLASGAITAMHMSALAPFATAAGLVLCAGALTVALSAEQTPPAPAMDNAPSPPATAPANLPTPGGMDATPAPNGQERPQLPRPQVTNWPERIDAPAGDDAPRQAATDRFAAMKRFNSTKIDLAFEKKPRLEAIQAICAKAGFTCTVEATVEQVAAWNTPGTWTFAATPALQAIRTVCGSEAGGLVIGVNDSATGLVLRPRPVRSVQSDRRGTPAPEGPDPR